MSDRYQPDEPGTPEPRSSRPAGGPGNAVRSALRRLRPYGLGIGLTTAAAAIITVGVLLPGPAGTRPAAAPPPAGSGQPRSGQPRSGQPGSGPPGVGAVPARLTLAAYDSCTAMLQGLRSHTARQVTAYGLGGGGYAVREVAPSAGMPVSQGSTAAGSSAPDHSTTNDQERAADEPDIVKNDGRRVVSVSGGVLRVVDAASRTLTGTLDLRMYAGADDAQLLLAGDRALVLLGGNGVTYRGPIYAGPAIGPTSGGSTYLLVDIAATPTVLGAMHVDGGYVDARLIGGVVRLVVSSAPRLTFPAQPDGASTSQRLAANRAAVLHAPLQAWMPTYSTVDGGVTTSHTVPCGRVSHPARYSGTAMLTVYSIDPAGSLTDPHPVSIAADGGVVYASATDLYVASSDGTGTDLHRFYVGDRGIPRYVGSGRVPGTLFDSYSMSEYDGLLRVVTTSQTASSVSALYVLRADSLRRVGSVGGLGAGEQLHAVRFLGPLAYVVTFQSVDPLYVLDLRDPAHPRRAGELTMTGYSDYLHPTGAGRLLGVGQSVDGQQRVTGLQLSLFDVTDPAQPTRLAKLTRAHSPSETPVDPHAFLYWPKTGTAVLPIDSWNPSESGAALVVRVGRDRIDTVGTVRNPAVSTADSYDGGIQRTLVIGDQLWTMSGAGLQVSDLGSLSRRGWIPFG